MDVPAQAIHTDVAFNEKLEDLVFLRKIKLMPDSRLVIGELDKYIDSLIEIGAYRRIDNLLSGLMKNKLGYVGSLGALCITDQCKKQLVSYADLSAHAKAQGKSFGLSDEDVQKDFVELQII